MPFAGFGFEPTVVFSSTVVEDANSGVPESSLSDHLRAACSSITPVSVTEQTRCELASDIVGRRNSGGKGASFGGDGDKVAIS